MKHNKTFHKLFPDIPESEDLLHGEESCKSHIMQYLPSPISYCDHISGPSCNVDFPMYVRLRSVKISNGRSGHSASRILGFVCRGGNDL